MFDKAMRVTFSDLATFFLIAAVLLIPLELGLAWGGRRVIAVSELHGAIEGFPESRQVRGVGKDQLGAFRLARVLLWALELALLPLLAAATKGATDALGSGGIPTVSASWKQALGQVRLVLGGLRRPGTLALGAGVALAVGWLALRSGLLLVEPLSDARDWVGIGLVRGASLALALPFFLVPWALCTQKGEMKRVTTELY